MTSDGEPMEGASLPEIRRIEELSMNAWPAFVTTHYDGWVLRFTEGYTKRANSVLPLYESTIDFGEKVDRCRRFYHDRGLPLVFKVSPACPMPGLDAALETRGLHRLDETSLQTLSLAGLPLGASGIGRRPAGTFEVVAEERFTQGWIDGYCECSRIEKPERRALIARFLRGMSGQVSAVHVELAGRAVACGFGALDDGWIGLFAIVVDPDYRRQGIATELVRALLERGAHGGAGAAYLQVVASNAAAAALYAGLGFRERYRYWYRSEQPFPS